MQEKEAIWAQQNEANVLMKKIIRLIFLMNIFIERNIVYYQAGKFSNNFLLIYIWKKYFDEVESDYTQFILAELTQFRDYWEFWKFFDRFINRQK